METTEEEGADRHQGASHHMTNQHSYFTSFKEIPYSWIVNGIGGVQVKALGVGTVPIVSHINGESKAGTLHEVLFVPEHGTNFFFGWRRI